MDLGPVPEAGGRKVGPEEQSRKRVALDGHDAGAGEAAASQDSEPTRTRSGVDDPLRCDFVLRPIEHRLDDRQRRIGGPVRASLDRREQVTEGVAQWVLARPDTTPEFGEIGRLLGGRLGQQVQLRCRERANLVSAERARRADEFGD